MMLARKCLCYANKAHLKAHLTWMEGGKRAGEGDRGRWEDDKHFPSSSSRQERRLRAYIRICTQKTRRTYASPHIHSCQDHRLDVDAHKMQISAWGWPTEQSTARGQGKHIITSPCNDTLLVCVYFQMPHTHTHTGLECGSPVSPITMAKSNLVFYCTALAVLTVETLGSVRGETIKNNTATFWL